VLVSALRGLAPVVIVNDRRACRTIIACNSLRACYPLFVSLLTILVWLYPIVVAIGLKNGLSIAIEALIMHIAIASGVMGAWAAVDRAAPA
jgi:hypothetical protein